MDFKQLNYMLKVAECGNITHAAEQLYISQPALSSLVSKVEDELGAKVFDRTTSPLKLTTAGEYYIKTARAILELQNKLFEDVEDLKCEKERVLNIGLSDMRATFILPSVLPQFRRLYPNLKVNTIESKSAQVEQNVRDGVVDLGIVPVYCTGEDFTLRPLYQEEMLLVSAQDLPSEAGPLRRWVEPDVLMGRDLVLMAEPARQRKFIAGFFAEYGIYPRSIVDTSNHMTNYLLATTGMGLTIVPETVTRIMNPVHLPRIYRLGKQGLTWEICAIWRTDYTLSAAEEQLLKLLRDQFL